MKKNKKTHFWVHFEKYNIAFAFVPKIANTAMKTAFAELLKIEGYDKETGKGIHSVLQLKGVSPDRISKHRCVKIIFTRDPYDRIASLWQNKVKEFKPWRMRKAYKFTPETPFNEFVRYITAIPDEIADHHFRSQTAAMFKENGELLEGLMILQLENIREHWAVLQKIVPGLPDLKKLNVSKKRAKKRREIYDHETIELIRMRYKKDLEFLKYNF